MTRTRLPVLFTLVLWSAATTLSAAELTVDQSSQILQEASATYAQGQKSSTTDVAAAKDAFEIAADKYRLLIDSGIENSQLYENLGNASLQSGQLGAAIAAYEHAATLAPSDQSIRRHLDHARSLRNGGTSEAGQVSVMSHLSKWNQQIPLHLRLWVAIISWVGLWACLVGWLVARSVLWRRFAAAAAIVAALMAGSICREWSELPRKEYGIVITPTQVYTHDGETFPLVFEQKLPEGTRFDVVEHRDTWLRIQLADGTSGWIPTRSVDLITPRAYPWSVNASASPVAQS